MAKIEKIKVPLDIHLNIDNTFDFIDEHLPTKYAKLVQNSLPDGNKYQTDYIRKVKNDRINNSVIISYLYLIAEENFNRKNSEKVKS